jgi:hypothetical protein
VDVDAMLQSIPAPLFVEWQAFDLIEPISLGWRGDMQAGIIASLLANIYRDPDKKAEPFEPADFIPHFEPAQPQDPEEIYAIFRSWAMMAQKAQ